MPVMADRARPAARGPRLGRGRVTSGRSRIGTVAKVQPNYDRRVASPFSTGR